MHLGKGGWNKRKCPELSSPGAAGAVRVEVPSGQPGENIPCSVDQQHIL